VTSSNLRSNILATESLQEPYKTKYIFLPEIRIVSEMSEYHVLSRCNLKSIGWALRICSLFRTIPYKWDIISRRIKIKDSKLTRFICPVMIVYILGILTHLIVQFISHSSNISTISSSTELLTSTLDSGSQQQRQHHHKITLPFLLIWVIYYTWALISYCNTYNVMNESVRIFNGIRLVDRRYQSNSQ